jgi:hypothetical protein
MQWCSAYVAQIVKAKWYIAEPSGFTRVNQDTFELMGRSATHRLVRREDDTWQCDCAYARQSVWPCAHARALEKLLDDGVFGPANTETRSHCEANSSSPGAAALCAQAA